MLLKKYPIVAASALGLPKFFSPSPKKALTTILYHSFVFPEMTIPFAREQLKQQCDWLQKNYNLLSVKEAADSLKKGLLTNYSLTVTIDDALIDILDIYDIFDQFEVPITIYIAGGWTENASKYSEENVIFRLMDCLYWNQHISGKFDFSHNFSLTLSPELKNINIDKILQIYYQGDLELIHEIYSVLKKNVPLGEKTVCSWDDLAQIKSKYISFGSHSITHCTISEISDIQLDFEINESKKLLTRELGECSSFAYPFGTSNVWDKRTTDKILHSGYDAAFLTHSDFASNADELFTLPRIAFPDKNIDFSEFKSRTLGGAIPFIKLKEQIKKLKLF